MFNNINAIKSVQVEVMEPILCYIVLYTKCYSQTQHLNMCYPFFCCCTVHFDICTVHSPTNALFYFKKTH